MGLYQRSLVLVMRAVFRPGLLQPLVMRLKYSIVNWLLGAGVKNMSRHQNLLGAMALISFGVIAASQAVAADTSLVQQTVVPDGEVASTPGAGTFDINLEAFRGSFDSSLGDPDRPFQLTDATDKTEAKEATSAKCLASHKNPDADLGEVIKAGCDASLEQMSALMDNPVGNVAMFFTQFDLTRIENPVDDKTAKKYN
jgi:hypothetical protein